MGHFNHAYQKAFYMADHIVDNTKDTTDLTTAGDFAVVNVDQYVDFTGPATIAPYHCMANPDNFSELTGQYVAVADMPGGAASQVNVVGSPKKFMLAQGSFRNASTDAVKDILGGNPLHGGYLESVKSKDIQFRHINMLKEINGNAGTSQVVSIRFKAGTTADKGCFACGTDPMLRIDIKGADSLRMLSHNAYRNVDIGAICDCCDAAASAYYDVKKVVAEFAKNIAADPILSKLIDTTQADFFSVSDDNGATWDDYAVTVTNNAATSTYDAVACETAWTSVDAARLKLYMGVVDTTFGTCSFDTRDWTNVEPLTATVEVLDESGNSCDACRQEYEPLQGANYNNGVAATNGTIVHYYSGSGESVAPIQEMGNGTKALNDILLTENYRQNPYNQGNKDSARFRTIEGSADVLSTFSSTAQYYQFKLQHVVPRFNNPSGLFDNDQYLYTVYALDTNVDDIGTLSDMWDRIALHAGVTNETI